MRQPRSNFVILMIFGLPPFDEMQQHGGRRRHINGDGNRLTETNDAAGFDGRRRLCLAMYAAIGDLIAGHALADRHEAGDFHAGIVIIRAI